MNAHCSWVKCKLSHLQPKLPLQESQVFGEEPIGPLSRHKQAQARARYPPEPFPGPGPLQQAL